MSQSEMPPMQPYPNPYQYAQGQMPTTPRTSGLAIASLVCGVAGLVLCGIAGIAGLILGISAIRSINASQGMLTGKGLAIGGIVTSAISFLLMCLLAGLLIPALAQAREMAGAAKQRIEAQELAMIVADYDFDSGTLPAADDWVAELGEYISDQYYIEDLTESSRHPEDGRILAMNMQLEGKSISELQYPNETVLFFECAPRSPLAGGVELMPAKPRSRLGFLIVFTDGTADHIRPDDLDLIRWSP